MRSPPHSNRTRKGAVWVCGANTATRCSSALENRTRPGTVFYWVFFTGFVMVNAALLFLQVLFAQKEKVTRADSLILMFNALFLGAGILANLDFE